MASRNRIREDGAETLGAAGESGPVADEYPDHLFRWADAVGRRLNAELRTEAPLHLQALGGRRSRLLQMIPPDGLRVTDLARRAGVTKQAVGQLVDTLEELGLVASHPAPDDGRVRWVRRTALGDQRTSETVALIAAAEHRLRREVGARRYDAMLATMRDLGRDVRW